MSPHKGPQIIRYCVITSTVALIGIAVGFIPQFKVKKAKLLFAKYYLTKDTINGLGAREYIQKKTIGFEEANIFD